MVGDYQSSSVAVGHPPFRSRGINQKPFVGLLCYVSMVVSDGTSAGPPADAYLAKEARALFGLALSILRDRHEAEDAVQDTMEIAWKSGSSVRDEERQSAWLKKVCLRRCLRVRRGLMRRLFLSDIAPVQAQPIDPVDPTLDRACGELTRQQRAVITLHYHYGYSLDECATLMDCRPGTARSHLAHALATLRRQLGDDYRA